MYLVRTPELIKPFFKDLIWNVPGAIDQVYLTFDDGPIPEVTPWVLDQLAAAGAKATFFCIGENARKEPDLIDRIKAEGHTIGNHTWEHLNGWETSQFTYLRSVLRCHAITRSPYFRPPYGRISRDQARALSKRFKVIMWEVLSADFDQALSGEECARNVTANVRPGSIVVFHDSLKAWDRLRIALPAVLRHLQDEGLRIEALPCELSV